jgi:hypothetical protein
MKRPVVISVASVALVGAGSVALLMRSERKRDEVRQKELATPARAPQEVKSGGFALLTIAAPELAALLVGATDVQSLAISGARRDRAEADAIAWLSASMAEDFTAMATLMQESGIVPIASWHSDEAFARESWEQSRETNLLPVDFDPSLSSVRMIDIAMPDPLSTKSVKRCSRRDSARSFLQMPRDQHDRDMVLTLGGTLRESGASVSLTYRFAWNKEVQRWALIQVCLYDFPNDQIVASMML